MSEDFKFVKLEDLEIYSQEIDLGVVKLCIDFNARFNKEPIEIDLFVGPKGYYAVWSP